MTLLRSLTGTVHTPRVTPRYVRERVQERVNEQEIRLFRLVDLQREAIQPWTGPDRRQKAR